MTKKMLYIVLFIWCMLNLLNIVWRLFYQPEELCDPDVIYVDDINRYFDAMLRCDIYD